MAAYGKTPTAFLRSDQAAVNLAAVMALRDAGANFATSFTRVPDVAAWMDGGQQAIDNPPAEVDQVLDEPPETEKAGVDS